MIDDRDDDEEDDADEAADRLTDALHRAVRSGSVLNYRFHRDLRTGGWLLLRWESPGEKPASIAEYPSDQDVYQMHRSAVASVRGDIARYDDRKGLRRRSVRLLTWVVSQFIGSGDSPYGIGCGRTAPDPGNNPGLILSDFSCNNADSPPRTTATGSHPG